MKSNRVSARLFGATMVLACSGFSAVVQAQNVTAPTVQRVIAPTVQRVIPLKNVPPVLMAWWIDPAHNPDPAQLTGSNLLFQRATTAQKSPPAPKAEKGIFALPTGVQQVNPIEQQQAVLILGTEAGIAELQKTTAFLDKPLRQVEIEAQFIVLAPSDTNEFGVDFGALKPGQASVGFVRGNFYAKLAQLIAQNKAKIITAPRVLAINNLPASMRSSNSRPVVLGFKDETGKFRELPASTSPQENHSWFLDTSLEMTVTPTINNDDTVTLLMSPKRVLQLNGGSNDQKVNLRNSGRLETIANVRDGDTIALGGLDARLFASPDDKTPASNIVIFVTARIVRRADKAQAETIALPH